MSLADIEGGIADYAKRGRDGKVGHCGYAGRHFHHHQRWYFRLLDVYAHFERATNRNFRHAQNPRPPHGSQWPGGDPADDVSRSVLRSPHDRRQRSGAVLVAIKDLLEDPARLLLDL